MTEQTLRKFIGHTAIIRGQEFMLVGFDGDYAVFENEDERLVRLSFVVAHKLLKKNAVS